MVTDALGNEIIVGNWYGYSANDGGHSHTTLGKAGKITEGDGRYTPAKVRLIQCKVKRYIYGQETDYRKDEKPNDVTIRASMIFPVPPQE